MKTRVSFLTVIGVVLITSAGWAAEAVDVIAKIFENKSDAVVLVAVQSKEGDRLGSGFFISRDGKLVTNYHLIRGARKVLVKHKSGIAYAPTDIINLDPAKDIAILKIDRTTKKYFSMADSNDVAVGQRVCTIGNPMGLESSVSDGLISSIRVDNIGMKIFQISVPLSQGSSGGPLIDLNGDVVGITTARLNSGENLNFAIPINYVKILLKKPFDSSQFRTESKFISPTAAQSPVTQSNQTKVSHSKIYVVQKGDSLYRIARKYKTSVKALMQVNQLKGSQLKVGQKLILP